MRQLKALFEKHDRVWFYLPDEEAQARFLAAVKEHDPGNTLEISQIGTHMAYGVDRRLRYVSWLAWSYSFCKGFSISKIPKVDFQKYLTGADGYYIIKPDVCCLGFDK